MKLFTINIANVHSSKLLFKNADGLCISSAFLDYVFYLSVIIFFIVTRFFNFNLFSSLVGIYFYLIVPYIVGESLCNPLFEDKLIKYFGKASKYYLEWVFGVMFLTVLLAILQVLGLNSLIMYAYVFAFVSIVLNILVYFFKGRKNEFYITFSGTFKYLLFSMLLGVAVVAIIKIFFLPIPNIGFNFDIPYTTYHATVRLLEDGYVTLVWRWVEFIIPGIVCPLLNLDPLYFIAVAPFSMMILYTAGIYLLSYSLFKKPKIAFIAVLLSIFINIGSTPISLFIDNWAYVYRSNTILASVFPLSLFLMQRVKAREKFNRIKFLILSFLLLSVTLLFYVFFNTSWIHVENFGLPVGFLGYYVFPIVSFSIFVIMFFLASSFKDKKTIFTSAILVILLLTTFLMHYAEAVLFGLLLSLFCFLCLLPTRQKKFFSFLMVYTTLLFCILQARGIISRSLGLLVLTKPLPSAYLKTGFDDKWNLFFDTVHPYNTYLLLVLLAINVVFVLLEKNDDNLTISSSMWAMLLFFFLPEFFTYRGYHILTPLMGITFAYIINELGQRASSFFTKSRKRLIVKVGSYTYKLKSIRAGFSPYGLTVVLLLVLVFPLLFLPFYSRYSFFPEGSESNSYFADYDYQVTAWIKENAPKNAIILSDYFSMKMYQGLSSRPVLFRGLNAGEESNEAQAILWFIKQNILLAPTSEKAYDSISSFVKNLNESQWIPWQEKNTLVSLGISLDNPNVFIIINPRTCVWLKQHGISDVRPPYNNVNLTYLEPFHDSDYFKLVYKVENEMYIFRPTHFFLWHAADYPAAVGQNLDDSETAHWSFDEGNGSILIDNSEYGNNGTIYGATWTKGKYGKALSFDGVNNYVSIPNSPILNPDSDLSVEAWIYPLDTDREYQIIGKNKQFMLRIDPSYDLGTVSFFVWINGYPEPRARGIVLPANVWSHVVGTYNGVQVKIYVNGQLAGSSYRSGLIDNTTNPVTIGNIYGHYFTGSIDEVHIYNRALSEQEVKEHYEGKYANFVRKAATLRDSSGYMVDIPFKVDHTLEGEIKIRSKVNVNNLSETAFRCELYDNTSRTLILNETIKAINFTKANTYENLYLGVTIVLEPNHDYELRIYFADTVDVWIDTITILIRDGA